jgi:protocatechuate 3,4-dioxygenase, beta subunit
MERRTETRRSFLKGSSAVFALPFILSCGGGTVAQKAESDLLAAIKKNAISDPNCEWCGARDAPADVSWKTSLAGAAETGEKLRVSGSVFRADGITPAAGTLIYFYHTDAHGKYGRDGQHRHGQYRGWMLTDAKGRYEFTSIIPASYPNSTIAKHIHMTVTSRDLKEDWIDSILFDGDKFITERERTPRKGGFDPVMKLQRGPDGIMSGVRNIRLP